MPGINNTLQNRGKKYGNFADNANITQNLFDIIIKSPNFDILTNSHKEVIHMIFHKIARMVCGDPNYSDNPHDIAGYATLLENELLENTSLLNIDNDHHYFTNCKNCKTMIDTNNLGNHKI